MEVLEAFVDEGAVDLSFVAFGALVDLDEKAVYLLGDL